MLTLPPSVKIYVAASPVDCRKSFNGLSSMVESTFGVDPLSGHLFVFLNRRGDQIRLLFFDRTGYCIVSKRLERGPFDSSVAQRTARSTWRSTPESSG